MRQQRRSGLLVLAAMSALLLIPSGASAATIGQVKAQVRGLHLSPSTLFPGRLPSSFRGASFKKYSSFEIDIGWWRFDSKLGYTNFRGSFRRDTKSLKSFISGPNISFARRIRIGHRRVYFVSYMNDCGPFAIVWREHRRTYWVDQCDVNNERQALRILVPFVKSLRWLR